MPRREGATALPRERMPSSAAPPPPTLSRQLGKLHRGLRGCAPEAALYAKCCTAGLPAIGHKQCQREFETLTACIRKTLAGAKK
eukprot:COSAG06_NODE_436_length_15778_cov_40.864741_7_plen_84_part_00